MTSRDLITTYLTAARGGDRATAYTVRDGQVVAIDIFEGDQYAVDELVH